MARYLYDVNRTTRFFDVHKQFQGGLKTVDTDDALGAVFLREGQNVSLSEFGFIEKRYGTYLNNKVALSGNLQGYFEFKDYKIYAANNRLYVNGTEVTTIEKEKPDDWRYPILPAYPFVSETYRDMNAVNINEVLYIFTGFYPVYAKVVNVAAEGETEDLQLKFYWFSADIPTYDEIVVVGHNLLEDDYEGLYFPEDFKTLTTPGFASEQEEKIALDEADFIPKIPYAGEDGKIDLKLSYKYNAGLGTFDYQNPITLPDGSTLYDKYYQLKLDRVDYRSSGAGASTIDYLTFEEDSVTHSNDLDNLGAGNPTPDLPFEGFLYNKVLLTSQEFEQSSGGGGDSTFYHAYTAEIIEKIPREALSPTDVFNLEFFKSTSNPNSPWESILFSDFHYNPANLGPSSQNNVITLEITPYDSNESLFEAGKVSIPSSEIDISNHSYKFVIPSTISTSDFVFGYQIYFKHTIVDDVVSIGNNYAYSYEDFSKSLSRVLETNTFDQFLDHNFLTVSATNLLSGIYDIRPVYKLEEYNYTGSSLELNKTTEISYTFSNINITAEKLQDYPGAENVPVKLKAVWTCNKVIEHFGKLMIWGSKEMPTAVFYSFPDRPTFFPSKFYLDFQNDEGSALQNITPYMNILVAQTEDRTWGVRGNSGLIDAPSPYVSFTINPTVGTIAYKSVRPVRNHLFFLSKQGIIALKSLYAADEQYNIEFVDRNIRNIVPQDKNAVGIQYDNQYWLNFPNFGITLRWYIDKKAWVKDVFAWGDDFKGVFKWQNVDGKLEFITYPNALQEDTNDYVYKIGVDESLPADMGSNILTKFETSFLNQNYPFHQKNYKEFKYDFTMQNEYNFSRDPIYDETFEITDEVSVLGLQASGLTQPLLRNHTYMLSFSDVVEVDTVEINGVLIENLQKFDGSYYLDGNTDYFFVMPNSLNGKFDVDIQLTAPIQGINERVSLRDTTYDETMVFLSKIITEERNVINQQLPIGYTEQQESIEINLADFQDFTLGTTFFGDRITFIKTIKLSGKGYNTKAYFEDVSKAKWTVESMGITYKMKRARGD